MVKGLLVLIATYVCLLSSNLIGVTNAQTTTTAASNPCDIFPCMNGGLCVVLSGSAYCACPKGFTGTFCEIGICFRPFFHLHYFYIIWIKTLNAILFYLGSLNRDKIYIIIFWISYNSYFLGLIYEKNRHYNIDSCDNNHNFDDHHPITVFGSHMSTRWSVRCGQQCGLLRVSQRLVR